MIKKMLSRDPAEPFRAATPLELLYDLCFVVAIAQAATGLHHGISSGHGREAALWFGFVFFAIWWAWMGFAWFASAFDNDDPLYRLKVFVQMLGVLVLASGVPRAIESHDFGLVTFGYAIMRAGLISQWLRARRANPSLRTTAARYAGGTAAVQAGWLGLLLLPTGWWIYGWMVLAPLELFVPWWAERAGATPWHPHHIAERHGLFTIIVIGESVLAATLAIQSAIDLPVVPQGLASVVIGAPIILFAMWWLYFCVPAHTLLTTSRAAFIWGYGHYWVFASAAAAGAGLAVLVDQAVGGTAITDLVAGAALAVPVAAYLLSLWALHVLPRERRRLTNVGFPIAAAMVLLAPMSGVPAIAVAVVLTALTATTIGRQRRERDGNDESAAGD